MQKKGKKFRFLQSHKTIMIFCVIIIMFGVLIPEVYYPEIKVFPGSVQNGIETLVEAKVENLMILGYELIGREENVDESVIYIVRAYTIFGLTYADIYICVDSENQMSSGGIQRKWMFAD